MKAEDSENHLYLVSGWGLQTDLKFHFYSRLELMAMLENKNYE